MAANARHWPAVWLALTAGLAQADTAALTNEPASFWYALLIAVFAGVVAVGVLIHQRGDADEPADPHPTEPGVRHADEEGPKSRR